MLFEFHRHQNAKKPGTIHATYLIIGTVKDEEISIVSNGTDPGLVEDDFIQSSPFTCSPPSISDESVKISVQTITLVRELDLEKIRSKYEHIDSIHVYSLGPYPVKDLQILSEASQRSYQLCPEEDPIKSSSIYGAIQNKYVKLRVEKRPSVIVKSSSIKRDSSKVETVDKNKISVTELKVESKDSQLPTKSASAAGSRINSSTKDVADPPEKPLVSQSISKAITNAKPQKLDKTSIFSAFARTGLKQKHESKDENRDENEKNCTTEKAVASIPDDFPMKDVSSDDDNDDDDEIWAPLPSGTKKTNSSRKSRKEREQELKKMMEDDDNEEDKAEKEEKSIGNLVSNGTDLVTTKDIPAVTNEPSNLDTGKKRRSRRRVIKKSTFKDEDGYLVTKEEPAWESFSEDESVLPVPKPVLKIQPSTTSKSKKGTTGKSSQGNIMSFFGKKS